jgi:hypothetical protein
MDLQSPSGNDRAMTKWMLIALGLMTALTACSDDPKNNPWQWGGPPNTGQYQAHHPGDSP